LDYGTLQKKITSLFNLSIKKIAYFVGGLISLISLFFSIYFIYQHQTEISFIEIIKNNTTQIIGLIIISTLLNLFLGLAWYQILLGRGVKVSLNKAIKIYGITQLAKYIPGNIFQFVGRQGIGMSEGINAKKLALSSLIEIILLSIVGGVCFVLFAMNKYPSYINITFLIILIAIFFCIPNIKKNDIYSFFLYLFYVFSTSLIFVYTFKIVSHNFDLSLKDYLNQSFAYIFAWFLGFITPGSPAGLGIREITLAKILQTSITSLNLAVVIIISRLISLISDINFFLLSAIFFKHKR
jgi:glycosyltransferase 2 family protein